MSLCGLDCNTPKRSGSTRTPVQTERQGWGKAHDSFLPPLRRSRVREGRSYVTHNPSRPCHSPMSYYVYTRWTLGGASFTR